MHNHLIFCAVDNIEHKHYHDCKKSYWNIRKLNDQICKEHHLSVIEPSPNRGKTYKEWQENQNGTSWKTQLRKDINQAIKATGTYEEFLALLKAKGYELKNESFDIDSGKYIAFRPLGEQHFIRGRATPWVRIVPKNVYWSASKKRFLTCTYMQLLLTLALLHWKQRYEILLN